MKKIFLLLLLIAINYGAYADKGYLRGKILDGDTGEGLIGATIQLEGTTNGTVADFNGNYSLALDPGTYNFVFQFVSYQSKTVKDVEIKADDVNMLDITLSSITEQLEEIVITAEQINNNEVALLTIQKKSPNVVNGISSQSFKKFGDGDLGIAMKRVTGVSVENGKYIYVRGLGDRYTKTLINGMAIPGLDPDRNTVQIDIFPTSTIENVIVYKTFSPDLPADFTGGIVYVTTKKFPEEKTTSISLGMEYNPRMHFNEGFVSYNVGKTDWLGFDDGNRNLPFNKNLTISDISSPEGMIVEDITRSFNPDMSAQNKTSFMNYMINIAHGNQINRAKATWGYNFVLNYQNRTELYDNTEFGEYAKNTDSDITELDGFHIRRGSVGNNDILWSTLFSGALKFDHHSFSIELLHNQNGVSSTTDRISEDLENNPSTLLDDILTFTQRQVSTGILSGQHKIGKFEIDWSGSYSKARIYEPDFRLTRIQRISTGEGRYDYSLNTGVGAGISRFWRDLNEQNESFRLDITYPYGEKNKIKFGGLSILKQRDFEVLEYAFRVRNRGNITITDNPDDYFSPENIWTKQTGEGTFTVSRNSEIENKVNSFSASSVINGFYAMAEHHVGNKFRTIFGVRLETAQMYYTGSNQLGEGLNNEQTLNKINFLPSLNLVYDFNDKMNLRLSYNKTLARPSFKEKSNAQIYDPISDRTTIGNLSLGQTTIDNYDLRWEYYFGKNELISTSVFYKRFDGHIERTAFQTAPDQLTYTNAGKSTVYGVEFEVRKNIVAGLSAGLNVSVIKSNIDMNDIIVNTDALGNNTTEKENRLIWAREGEKIMDTRDMVGQAPFLVNMNLNWTNNDHTINANLSYNVKGRTLSVVGSGRWPDIYTAPFNSLNFNIYRDFGVNKNSRINFRVTNILNSVREDFYVSYGANNKTFSYFTPGRGFSLMYRFTF